jgi:hypothetical protein
MYAAVVPQNFYVGGGIAETVISPVAAVILVICGAGVLLLPRKSAVAFALAAAILVPAGNVVVLAGVHLVPVRVLAIVGILRLLKSKFGGGGSALFAGGITPIDKAVLGWTIFHALAFVLLLRSSGALVNQCGFLLGTLGFYLLLRHFIRDKADIRSVIGILAIVTAVNGAEMLYEQFTGRNLFSLLGGVAVSSIREGHIRSQGAFQHPILAGAFGGVLPPLFVILWKSEGKKALAALGVMSSALMAFCTWSSTPLFVFLGGIAGICLWPLRRRMRTVRWGIVVALLGLQMFMRAPVWFLIQRVELSGTSGYHRAILVDNFVRHFGDWWLVGTQNMSTWDFETWDTSNEFVSQGETGGLLTFIFFMAIICRVFGRTGAARKAVEGKTKQEWFFWLLGVCMFTNVLAFFGVSYWDQSQVGWLAFLALTTAAIASQADGARNRKVQAVCDPATIPELGVKLPQATSVLGTASL